MQGCTRPDDTLPVVETMGRASERTREWWRVERCLFQRHTPDHEEAGVTLIPHRQLARRRPEETQCALRRPETPD